MCIRDSYCNYLSCSRGNRKRFLCLRIIKSGCRIQNPSPRQPKLITAVFDPSSPKLNFPHTSCNISSSRNKVKIYFLSHLERAWFSIIDQKLCFSCLISLSSNLFRQRPYPFSWRSHKRNFYFICVRFPQLYIKHRRPGADTEWNFCLRTCFQDSCCCLLYTSRCV